MAAGEAVQAQDRQKSEAPPRRSAGIMPMVVPLVVGLVVGAAASWAPLFGTLDRATPFVDGFLYWFLPVLGVSAAVLAVTVPLAWWGLRRFVKGARGTLEQVVKETTAATRAVTERDAPTAAVHAEQAVLEAIAWYGPIAAQRWVVSTLLALLIAFGGLIGTALLFRQTLLLGDQNAKLQEQTALLRDQNAKLDLQTVTAEAQRRADLAAELFSILQAVSTAKPEGQPQLEPGLTARIVAFSRAATPYWTIEVPATLLASEAPTLQFADRPRSPERGQLLTGLVGSKIPLPTAATFPAPTCAALTCAAPIWAAPIYTAPIYAKPICSLPT
jgi:hypothetical protein